MGRLVLPRWLRVTGSVAAVLLAVIGLAGLPDDIKKWSGWLAQLDAEAWRIGIVIIGVVVFLGLQVFTRNPFEAPASEQPSLSPEPLAPESEPHPKPRPVEQRVVIDVTAEFLTGLFKDRMTIQAQKLADGFIGKWMTVTGPIGNVSAWSTAGSQVTFNRPRAATVYMYFHDESVVERLSMLKHGDRMTVLGQIERVQFDNVLLDPCELVRVVIVPIRDQLVAAHARGSEILAEVIDAEDDAEVSAWKGRHEAWRSETYDWLSRDVRIEDAFFFDDAPEVDAAAKEMRLVETFGSFHNGNRARLKRELSNLTSLIERSRND